MKAQEKEKKNRKRGMIITLFFHAALIAAALIPFTRYINQDNSEIELLAEAEPDKIYTELNTEVIMSNETSTSGSRASAKPLHSEEPKPDPSPAPEPKEVLTDNTFMELPLIQPETPNNNENLNPAPPTPVTEPNAGTISNSNTNGTGTVTEEIGGSGNGTNGSGIWGNDNGEGKFRRKVVSRPEADLKKLTKQRGTIVVRLAIDRDGKILDSKYMKELSSIQHDNMGKAAAKIAKKYRFDRDYTVPEIQYCNITIIFEQ